jgi:hypothetical protein
VYIALGISQDLEKIILDDPNFPFRPYLILHIYWVFLKTLKL